MVGGGAAAALLALQCASNALHSEEETEQNTVRYRSRPYKGCATAMPMGCSTAMPSDCVSSTCDDGTVFYNEKYDC